MSRPLLSRLAWVLPPLLALVPAAGARAAEVAFTGVLPNGALYTTPVQSMRENRYANLVRQQTDTAAARLRWPPSCAMPTTWMPTKPP